MNPIPVILESPFAGFDITYTHLAIRHSIRRNEAPFASHVLYTTALDDNDPHERTLGMSCGFAWIPRVGMSVAYCDYGISSGMLAGILHALANNKHVHIRTILEPEQRVHNISNRVLATLDEVLVDMSKDYLSRIVLDYIPKNT